MSTSAAKGSKEALSRPKPMLSCKLCRSKKIKCNRQLPCQNCAKLPTGSCVYYNLDQKTTGRRQVKGSADLNVRIERLEKLMHSVAANPATDTGRSQQSATLTAPGAEDVPDTPPQLRTSGEDVRFIQASHWKTILNEIVDIKDDLHNNPAPSTAPDLQVDHGRSMLLFEAQQQMSRTDAICSVPTRQCFDSLLEIFVRDTSFSSLLLVIHLPTFNSECDAFWSNPRATSLTWLALLYAVMSLALQSALREGAGIDGISMTLETSLVYSRRAAQCLVMSDYSKPRAYTVEAMLLYLASEHYWNVDNDFGAMLVHSLIVQIALRMGYHRDPHHYSNLSLIEAEMRRRVWAFITQMDLVLSEKCGQPRVIDERHVDTLAPANLTDDDLVESRHDSPSPQPDHVATSVSYMNYKIKLFGILRDITDSVNAPDRLSYEEIMALDIRLSAVADHKPLWLQIHTAVSSESTSDIHADQILEADVVLLRSRIVLHRRYLVPARSNLAYSKSRHACLSAAKRIISYQQLLTGTGHEPDGRPSNWRSIALMSHDFMLASLIICLDIDQDLRARKLPGLQLVSDTQEEYDKYRMLKQCHIFWHAVADGSESAMQGEQITSLMLKRVHEHKHMRPLYHGPGNTSDLHPTPYSALHVPINHAENASTFGSAGFDVFTEGQIDNGEHDKPSLTRQSEILSQVRQTNRFPDQHGTAPEQLLDEDFDWTMWDANHFDGFSGFL